MKRYVLLLAACCLPFLPTAAHTQESAASLQSSPQETRTPLVIIRFNQRNVSFERALTNAVAKALETKPDVVFDVVLRPGLRSAGENQLARVVSSMRGMGVADAQIFPLTGRTSGERHDEVHIYVR